MSENIGQCKLNEKSMKVGSSLVLGHKSLFTVGDRSFRWEYPPDSSLAALKKTVQETSVKSPLPKVLTPNNRQNKGTAPPRFNVVKSVDDYKMALPLLG